MEVWGAHFSLGTPSVPSGSPSALRSSRVCSPPASRVCARVPLQRSRGSSPDTPASGWGEADSAECAAFPQSLSLDSPVSGVQPCNPSPCPPSPLEGRGPVPLSARPLLFLQRAQQPGKGNELPVPRRPAVVRHNMTLRPHDVMSQACAHDLLHVENVVAEDDNDPEYSHDYAKDIYQYLRELEVGRSRPKYLTGKEISGKMRAILIDRLVQLQINFELRQNTLYMSVAIIDCFLQVSVSKMLQLVGVTAVFIASKYEEQCPLCAAQLACVTNYTYTARQIIQMEIQILQALDFCLSRPLASEFLKMALEVAKVDERVLAKYLMELSIVDYDMVHFPPSKIAAAASCLSLKLLNGCKWVKSNLPLQAIKKKYASSKNTKISTIEQLNSSVIWNLARSVNKKL
uniref:Cyclin B1 n=1 Tax=Amazona collaria TaxID=241587 RepID=A0A8B9FML8_9PSIT